MKDSLVALNITLDRGLLNKTDVPILFYWDGESDVMESILTDPGFNSLLKDTVMNPKAYPNAKISIFYFTYDGQKEQYDEGTYYIQNLIKLSAMDEETRSFYKMYLYNHFMYLYDCAYHEQYDKSYDLFNVDENILDIYDKIQKNYPKRVIKATVLNYIRGELQAKDGLNTENCNWIIYELEKLLEERN